MQYENLKIELHNGIALVTISREKALNALNTQTIQELAYFFGEQGPGITGLKGVILTGAGEKSFVAGADITEFNGLDAEQGAAFARRGQEVFLLIERFHLPVIAAVNGFALGGGCELAMACHLRIAGEKAKFGQPEVNLGLIPGYGGTQRLVQYIGKGKALELLLTADMVDAAEAYRLGLVNCVVPAGEEVGKATEILEKIATKAPFAISKVLECVNGYFEPGGAGFTREVDAFGACCTTEDFREGAAAFVEKRKANFKGR
ncbi:MAG: enoyl-CoA hydratase/isomerase family protein [Saprospirales bacterium]|nr:enoyl-CoA hydratase/isomerase family protein [Saprospirales bacterium]MBK8922356.1 enoyl-CoA hydratase/isomerase family protein [Saprospirales bacterium]